VKTRVILVFSSLILLFSACSDKKSELISLKKFQLDNTENILANDLIVLDSSVTSNGTVSIRIETERPITVPLFRVENIDIENARLIYRAKVRTKNFQGKAFLEMWCEFEGQGQFFSRDLQTPVIGDTDWITEETIFYLKEGEKPDRVYLNVVIHGNGTLWIDEIELLKSS
jgi:hypothetical protein